MSSGLLGSWNNNSADDLSPANGGAPLVNSQPKQVYEQVVYSCTYFKKNIFYTSNAPQLLVIYNNELIIIFIRNSYSHLYNIQVSN